MIKKHKNILFYTAFTMIEIVFVIVILGILSYVGSLFIPDNRLINDTKYIILQIKQKQKVSTGYDSSSFGRNPWSIYDEKTCITLDKNSLNSFEKTFNEQKNHRIVSDITVDGDATVCFDILGRPYHPGEEHILLKDMDINITKDGKTKIIKLYRVSGYVTITQ